MNSDGYDYQDKISYGQNTEDSIHKVKSMNIFSKKHIAKKTRKMADAINKKKSRLSGYEVCIKDAASEGHYSLEITDDISVYDQLKLKEKGYRMETRPGGVWKIFW